MTPGQRRQRTVEHLDRLGGTLCAAEREREHHRRRCAAGLVRRNIDRRLQIARPVRQAGARLCHAQLEQQVGLQLRSRRLGQRTTQVHGGRLRRATARGGPRGLDEALHDPRVSRRIADQQVLGHELVRARLCGEQLGRAAMALGTLAAGQLRVDPRTHDRVDEGERAPGLEDARRREHVGGLRGLGLAEAGQSRGLDQFPALQHGDCPCQAPCRFGQAVEPQPQRAADRARADALDAWRGGCIGRDALLGEGVHQGAQQERRSARRAQAGIGERRLRRPAERGLDEVLDRCSRQRRQAHDLGRGVRRDRRQQVRPRPALARPAGDDERDVELLEPRQQEGEVAQRRPVRPVRVVDDETERPLGCEIGAQPVEPVQDRERGIDASRGLLAAFAAREVEQARSDTRSTLQPVGSLGGCGLGEHRLEQLPHDAEGEVALELGAA